IGPEEIYIEQLLGRIKSSTSHSTLRPEFIEVNQEPRIKEIILATNPTMEGEATAMFLAKQLRALNKELRITRIGRGLPTGADIEYADSTTLEQAMQGRSEY